MLTCAAYLRIVAALLSTADPEFLTCLQAAIHQEMKAFQLSASRCGSVQKEPPDGWQGLPPTPNMEGRKNKLHQINHFSSLIQISPSTFLIYTST